MLLPDWEKAFDQILPNALFTSLHTYGAQTDLTPSDQEFPNSIHSLYLIVSIVCHPIAADSARIQPPGDSILEQLTGPGNSGP